MPARGIPRSHTRHAARGRVALALAALSAWLGGCAVLPAGPAPEPAVQRVEAEDDHVQVSELRVRGQTQRVVITPKDSRAPRYEINQPAGGADPSRARDGAGQRVWHILSF